MTLRKVISLLFGIALPVFAQAEKFAVVAVQPLGSVTAERLQVVTKSLEQAYGVSVELIKAAPLPQSAWYAPRGCYRAIKLLNHLNESATLRHPIVIGITEKDISTSKGEHVDWGIFRLFICHFL